MNDYDNAIYKYLTTEANYRNMINVMDQYEMVRKRLIIDFWDEVVQQLNQNDRLPDWEAFFNVHKPFEPYWGIHYTHKSWRAGDTCLLSISWEGLHQHANFGVWRNLKSDLMGAPEVWHALREMSCSFGFTKDNNDWWPFWRFSDGQFQDKHFLGEILPENRSSRVSEIVNTTTELALKILEQLPPLVRTRLNFPPNEAPAS